MEAPEESLLLGFSAPIIRDREGRLYLESQTISGLRAWRKHFARIVAFSIARDGKPLPGWEQVGTSELLSEGIEIVPLPDTYHLRTYLRQRRRVSRVLLDLMRRTRWHSFAYGGWIGDPGEIAAATARRHGIAHAVWFDRVESQVALTGAQGSASGRAKARLRSWIMARNENRAVRRADLSLLHGATVFGHFQARSRNPHLVEDVHFSEADRATADLVARKQIDAAEGTLRLLYCGRADAMKGPLDWISVLVGLKARGVSFTARWVGDGDMLGEMRAAATAGGLTADDLHFEGFIADRARVLDFYQRAHLLLFCHLADESPRNLIESLHAATPIVGYRDAYSSKLVSEKGAGVLVQRGATDDLAEAVAMLNQERGRLADLIGRAAASATALTREAVFRHRSDIIRSQLRHN